MGLFDLELRSLCPKMHRAEIVTFEKYLLEVKSKKSIAEQK